MEFGITRRLLPPTLLFRANPMQDTYARGLDGKIIYRYPEGYVAPNGVPVSLPMADTRKDQKKKEHEGLNPIEAAKKAKEVHERMKGEVDRLRDVQEALDKAAKTAGKVATKVKPNPFLVGKDVIEYVFEPLPGSDGVPNPPRPAFPPPLPTDPMPKPPGSQKSICGRGANEFFWPSDKPDACIAEFSIYRASASDPTSPLWRIGSAKRNTTREELAPFKFGIVQVYCPDGFWAMFPRGEDSVFTRTKPRKTGYAADNTINNGLGYWRIDYTYEYYVITGTQQKWINYSILWGYNYDVRRYAPPEGTADSGGNFSDDMWLRLDCIVKAKGENNPVVPPGDYDRKNDEEEMACRWQKDEIDYPLPELKVGANSVGGNSIKIDDGLIPLANFLIKSMQMMHKGIGLDQLDTDLPVSLNDRNGAKFKPASLAELSQWQFDNVSSLVGLPVVNKITNLQDQTKDLTFKNIQDCLSYLVHAQRESDNDLMVIENYSTRIAQQLEAVTQICLRQHADIEMLVKESGFRWKWETTNRKSLYKIGMKDDDEKTGILELFKGGEVSYPIRIWDDKVDARQIAMTTNLYAEIASRSNLHRFNSGEGLPGLDARVRMGKDNGENWKEWVKSVNETEKGTVSGGPTPFIEEYTQGTVTAKAVPKPTSGLSLFLKPKTAATDYKSKKPQ